MSQSSEIPQSYAQWVLAAEKLLAPLVKLMQPGAALIPLEGPASNHSIAADELESFARPCLLAGHWLAAQGGETQGFTREQVARWFREGMLAGTDPEADTYWGAITNYHQHSVETGALILAIEMTREYLWDPFSAAEKKQILDWMRTVRGCGLHRNNHLFFGVFPLSFLIKEGAGSPGDETLIFQWLEILESMYLGDGWFVDGMNETVDIYNAYAFHYYGLWWGKLYGDMDPARAQRWRDCAEPFLKDYVHFFAASGENIPYGRSMVYRFGASAPFGLAQHCGVNAVAPGLSRRLCTKNLTFFTDRLPEDQPLSLGWTDEFQAVAEAYSCAGSPYWAAKAFAPLLIDPADPFWQDDEQLLPVEGADFAYPIPVAGLVVRSVDGDIELFNAESGICPGNTGFGTYKWGKTSFRTGVGFEVKSPSGEFPRDAALTAETEDGIVFGRHSTHSLKCAEDKVAMAYVLGDKVTEFGAQVETHVWWNGGWQLQLHKVLAHRTARMTVGGYSLPKDDQTHFVELQAVSGWDASDTISHAGADRTHLLAESSEYPVLSTGWFKGERILICLSYCGKRVSKHWKTESLDESGIILKTDDGDRWEVSFG